MLASIQTAWLPAIGGLTGLANENNIWEYLSLGFAFVSVYYYTALLNYYSQKRADDLLKEMCNSLGRKVDLDRWLYCLQCTSYIYKYKIPIPLLWILAYITPLMCCIAGILLLGMNLRPKIRMKLEGLVH
jgi:hypothetical protein